MKTRDKELVLQTGLAKPYTSKTRCSSGIRINDVDELQKFADLIRADEREACVKIVELEAMQYSEPVWAFEIVNDILARGNTNG